MRPPRLGLEPSTAPAPDQGLTSAVTARSLPDVSGSDREGCITADLSVSRSRSIRLFLSIAFLRQVPSCSPRTLRCAHASSRSSDILHATWELPPIPSGARSPTMLGGSRSPSPRPGSRRSRVRIAKAESWKCPRFSGSSLWKLPRLSSRGRRAIEGSRSIVSPGAPKRDRDPSPRSG